MKVSKCPCVFHCTVSFEEHEHPLNLPLKVLPMFLEKDVTKMRNENLKSVKNNLLFLENKDFFCNPKKRYYKYEKTLTNVFINLLSLEKLNY